MCSFALPQQHDHESGASECLERVWTDFSLRRTSSTRLITMQTTGFAGRSFTSGFCGGTSCEMRVKMPQKVCSHFLTEMEMVPSILKRWWMPWCFWVNSSPDMTKRCQSPGFWFGWSFTIVFCCLPARVCRLMYEKTLFWHNEHVVLLAEVTPAEVGLIIRDLAPDNDSGGIDYHTFLEVLHAARKGHAHPGVTFYEILSGSFLMFPTHLFFPHFVSCQKRWRIQLQTWCR